MYNPIGLVHGGLVCTLLDSVLGCAVQTTLGVGLGYTSLEICERAQRSEPRGSVAANAAAERSEACQVSYLRPVRAGEGDLTAVGRVSRRGRRVSFADGEVRDSQGRLVATGSSTCLVSTSPNDLVTQ